MIYIASNPTALGLIRLVLMTSSLQVVGKLTLCNLRSRAQRLFSPSRVVDGIALVLTPSSIATP